MDLDDFWTLIEASAPLATTPDQRLAWLTDRLAERPADDVLDFAVRLDEVRGRADSWWLWGAAELIFGGFCSDDGFFYFQAWLVGLGRAAFDRVVADPDALADVPQVHRLAGRPPQTWDDAEWPDWEALDYVADEAYERITGMELAEVLLARGVELRCSPEPADDSWDPADQAETGRRYPRLVALFRLAGPPPAGRRSTADRLCQTASP